MGHEKNIPLTLEEIISMLQNSLFFFPLKEELRDYAVTRRETVVSGGGEEVFTAMYYHEPTLGEDLIEIGTVTLRRTPSSLTYTLTTRMEHPLLFYHRFEEALPRLGLGSTLEHPLFQEGTFWKLTGRVYALDWYEYRTLEAFHKRRKEEGVVQVSPGMYTRLEQGDRATLFLHKSIGLLVSFPDTSYLFNIPFRKVNKTFLTSKKIGVFLQWKKHMQMNLFFFFPPSYIQEAEEELRRNEFYVGLMPRSIAEISQEGLFRWLTRGEEKQFPFTIQVKEEPELILPFFYESSPDFFYLPSIPRRNSKST